MAVTKKVREWFQKEHGYPLEDAFELMLPESMPDVGSGQSIQIGRGYPFGSAIELGDVDSDNEQLAERLAKRTGRVTG